MLQCQHTPHVHPPHYATAQAKKSHDSPHQAQRETQPHATGMEECVVDMEKPSPPVSKETEEDTFNKVEVSSTNLISVEKLFTSPPEASSPIVERKKSQNDSKTKGGEKKKKRKSGRKRGSSTSSSEDPKPSLPSRSDHLSVHEEIKSPYKLHVSPEIHYACDESETPFPVEAEHGHGSSRCHIQLTDYDDISNTEC